MLAGDQGQEGYLDGAHVARRDGEGCLRLDAKGLTIQRQFENFQLGIAAIGNLQRQCTEGLQIDGAEIQRGRRQADVGRDANPIDGDFAAANRIDDHQFRTHPPRHQRHEAHCQAHALVGRQGLRLEIQ